ncbi:uncharacterized protein LOC134240555, partial [Saccostrea cucullata]|uniref:uncharacterized protein LOC134240555 n=1 Tax=Saccostrea cuccullata TaxID=36930 RepID=UPI002ED5DC70
MASLSPARQISQVSDEWPNCSDELAVRKSFVFLKDNIIYEDLRDDLIQEGIVSEKEEDAYVCEKNNMRSKRERLIKFIIRKKRCQIFIELLSRKSVFVAKKIIEARKQVEAEASKCVTRNPPFLVTDDLLQKHISCLHTQLEPREIADEMFQSGDITDKDHDTVTDPDRKYTRVTELLQILKKRNLYSNFVYVLQSLKYFQVLEILEKDIKMTKKP